MNNTNYKPADLRIGYKRTLELSFIITLLFLCSLFFSFQKYEGRYELPSMPLKDIIIEVIPPTVQPPKLPPKPQIPTVFIPDDDASALEENVVTDIFDIDPALDIGPPPAEEIEHIFNTWETSVKPEIKFQAMPDYPEIARKAGIEGKVSVTVVISEKGNVIKATILKGIPMLNDAALAAAKKCTFFPARQRDKYVKVKMSIPFEFRLN